MWRIKTRAKVALTIMALKVLFLLLICDFGHGYRTCAADVLQIAVKYPMTITYDTDVDDLCANSIWAAGPRFLVCIITAYTALDIVAYICLFYVEEKRRPRRYQVKFADGRLAFDTYQRPVMNLDWRVELHVYVYILDK